MARVGHRLACLQLAPLVQGRQERQQGRRGLSVSTSILIPPPTSNLQAESLTMFQLRGNTQTQGH